MDAAKTWHFNPMTGMYWKLNSTLALAALWLAACQAPVVDRATTSLVEVEDLQRMLESEPPVALIDVRPHNEFALGHLPGAINFWRTDLQRTDLPYSGIAIPADLMAEKLGAKGITAKHRIVLYDDRGGVEAARVWWLLRRYGHSNAAVLNGGLQAWSAPITTDTTLASPAVFTFSEKERTDMNVDYSTFEAWRQSPGVRLIDSRSEVEFSGAELKRGAFLAGHIPGATHFCYSNCVNFDHNLAMKDQDELRRLYEPLAHPTDTVLVYCHSGVRSAYTWFVLHEVLGYEHVYNYDGSWIEWSYFHQHDSDFVKTTPNASMS